jgi:hypothetical protein
MTSLAVGQGEEKGLKDTLSHELVVIILHPNQVESVKSNQSSHANKLSIFRPLLNKRSDQHLLRLYLATVARRLLQEHRHSSTPSGADHYCI